MKKSSPHCRRRHRLAYAPLDAGGQRRERSGEPGPAGIEQKVRRAHDGEMPRAVQPVDEPLEVAREDQRRRVGVGRRDDDLREPRRGRRHEHPARGRRGGPVGEPRARVDRLAGAGRRRGRPPGPRAKSVVGRQRRALHQPRGPPDDRVVGAFGLPARLERVDVFRPAAAGGGHGRQRPLHAGTERPDEQAALIVGEQVGRPCRDDHPRARGKVGEQQRRLLRGRGPGQRWIVDDRGAARPGGWRWHAGRTSGWSRRGRRRLDDAGLRLALRRGRPLPGGGSGAAAAPHGFGQRSHHHQRGRGQQARAGDRAAHEPQPTAPAPRRLRGSRATRPRIGRRDRRRSDAGRRRQAAVDRERRGARGQSEAGGDPPRRFGGVRVAVLRVAGGEVVDERRERRGSRRVERPGPRRGGARERLMGVTPPARDAARDERVKHAAQRVDVGSRVAGCTGDELGSDERRLPPE
jgi:hypothetical protein